MKKTVVLLTSHASKGGLLKYMSVLGAQFERDGFNVVNLALYQGDNDDPPSDMQILVARDRLNVFQYALALFRLVRFFITVRPTVTIGVMTLANTLAGVGTVLTRGHAISTHHSPIDTQNAYLRRIDRWVGIAGGYDRVICVSQSVADSFGNYPAAYKRLIGVITNGTPVESQRRSREVVRNSLGLSEGEAMLVMTGRLAPQKNVIVAALAAALTSNVVLCMSGDGPQREELEALIRARNLESKIRLLGMIPKQDLIDIVFCCDAFLQVSLYEGHSMSLLEAIVARRPIVVSKVPTQVEAVTLPDGTVAALLCDPQDPEDIARAMMAAAFGSPDRDMLVNNVNRLAATLKTEGVMLEEYSDLVRSTIDVGP